MNYRLPLKERGKIGLTQPINRSALAVSDYSTASVPLDRGLGAAFVPEWYVMSAIAAAAEVDAWDLCHHLVTQGFGVAGLSATEAAELDLEQPWITGIPVEHALAALRTCDKPTDPDTRLPTGPGYFWFRDSSLHNLRLRAPPLAGPQIKFAPPIFTGVGRCGERAV